MPDQTVPLTAGDLRETLCRRYYDAMPGSVHWDRIGGHARADRLAAMDAVLGHLASLAGTDRAGLAAHLTAGCTCPTTVLTYDGPDSDCPTHGAIRALTAAQADVGRLTPPQGWFLDLDGHGTRALWLNHPDSPADPWPRMLAAEHAGQEALWEWLATVIPTRTDQETPDA